MLNAKPWAQCSVEPWVLEILEKRVAAGLLRDEAADAFVPLTYTGRALADFVDQYVFYVNGVTPELLAPLEDAFTTEQLHVIVKPCM